MEWLQGGHNSFGEKKVDDCYFLEEAVQNHL